MIKTLFPEIYIKCFDFTPQALEKLKKVFIECDEISYFNMKNEKWPLQLDDEIMMLYRVDPEFSNAEWKKIFKNLYNSKIRNILFAPSEFLTLKRCLGIIKCNFIDLKIFRRPLTFTGYLRTKDALKFLWNGQYLINETFSSEKMTFFWLVRR